MALTLIAATLLVIPLFGIVQAGKGQEKLDFLLHLEGSLIQGSADGVKEAGVTVHRLGVDWMVRADFYIAIGEAGSVELITKPYLSYEGTYDQMGNTQTGFYIITYWETIRIYNSPILHDDTTLRGTLELLVIGENPGNNPAGIEGRFVGHGTDEFEGVKLSGTVAIEEINNPNPPPNNKPAKILSVDRVGTVMGWP